MDAPDIKKVREALNVLLYESRKCRWNKSEEADGIDPTTMHLLQRYPNVCKQRDGSGRLLLHSAVEECATFLQLEKIVSIYPEARSIGDDNGNTPLHLLFRRPFLQTHESIHLLASPEAARAQNINGELPWYDGTCMLLDVNVMLILVEAYPETLCHKCGNDGETLLHIATQIASSDDSSTIQVMIGKCPEALKIVDDYAMSPLHHACDDPNREGNTRIVEILVEAWPEAARLLDNRHKTPLHYLCQSPDLLDLSTVRLVLEAYPDAVGVLDDNNHTPLENLCRIAALQPGQGDKYLPLIECLLDACPDALKVRDSKGHTLLLQAVCSELPFPAEVVRFLASKCGDLLEGNTTTQYNKTPLHYLCEQTFDAPQIKIQLMRELAISASAVKAKDCRGRTALHILCQVGSSRDEMHVLLDKCPELATLTDRYGQVPLHLMAANGKSASETARFRQALQYLLAAFPGAVFFRDVAGITPLDLACESDLSASVINQLVRVNPVNTLRLGAGETRRSKSDNNAVAVI